jgi:hypothetical protein
MNDFPNFEFEGLGGLNFFNFIPTHDVVLVPAYYGSEITTPVTLMAGKAWYLGNSLPKTLRMEEKKTKTGTYEYTLTGITCGKDSDIIPIFEDVARREHLIDFTDNKGNRRLLGTEKYGASFTWDHDTQDAPAKRNEFSFKFEIELINPAPFYNPDPVS